MKITSLLGRRTLTLTLTTTLSLSLTLSAGAEPARKKKAATTVPDRIVITEEAPAAPAAQPEPAPPGPARPMTTLDATGTRRAPGEPRMITGSFIPVKFDLYANDANTAIPLQVYTQSDVAAKGRSFSGASSGGAVAPSYSSSMSATKPAGEEHVITRHTLDLRSVPPAQRLETAVRLLGEERGHKLVRDFNRWEAARKKRLSVRWTNELS